uniref:Putative peptidase family M23 n=2 Tax=root TaxID=1 RepID=B3TCW8_9BACT|nr:putative peptidase family M23/M37 [uncultured marine microorganism HF4000_005D21]ABZ10427.1 putative peptidase family M23 [uncultured marine bacterium HF4000_APKG3108]
MYQILKQNREKTKYFILFTFIITFSLLLTVVFKNDEKIKNKEINVSFQHEDLTSIKEFLLTLIKSPFININYEIKSGDSIQKILKKFKVHNNEIQAVINQYKKYSNPNQLLMSHKIDLIIEENLSEKNYSIAKFAIPITKSTTIEIAKDEQGKIVSRKIITKLYEKRILSENVIKNNLYSSAMEAKINPDTIIEFARIFGFEIDFQRDIRENDYFKIIYDKYFDENGEFVKSGSIYYAHMSVNGREITLYKFGDDKNYSYFDINGKSVEKALMKTPINGARLSSSFGMRKHPILGFNKKHTGTDFAAPSETPIMASGSGTIVLAKWCGGGGNCIKIKHNSTYETIYAHMKSFARGMKKGKKIRQGEIIGYVGSTGISTGPHLHYEVVVNGKKVNSQKLKLPSGKVLKDNERKLFEVHRIKTDVLIAEMIAKKK